jgi:hypothetical protein
MIEKEGRMMWGNCNYSRGGKELIKTVLHNYTPFTLLLYNKFSQELSYADYDPGSHRYNKMLTLL